MTKIKSKVKSKKKLRKAVSGSRRKSSESQSSNLPKELTVLSQQLCKRLHYQFSDPSLLLEAVTHRSKQTTNNERLEFLGDSILGYVVSSELFKNFPNAKEGQLSRGRASLVKGETLASMAKELELGEFLLLGPGELKSGGYRRDSILADAMEAIIGAIYLDGGLEVARTHILNLFSAKLASLSLDDVKKDPKTQLQEYLQARKKPLPKYQVVKTTGNDHEQIFEIECKIEGIRQPIRGSGKSRRRAEQDAASKVMAKLIAAEK